MTRTSIQEYAAAVRGRYLAARRGERTKLLDEFCRTTGYHRKAAIRLLRQGGRVPTRRRGRPRQYGPALADALRRVWEASDRLCGKRLAPFLSEFVSVLERQGELTLSADIRAQLVQLSAASIDRLLRPCRQPGRRRPYTQTGASAALKAQVPIRTFGEWAGVAPGAVQADLVMHCGESVEGFYLTTLTAVDVATGWTECAPVWGKAQQPVRGAVHRVRQRLPVALRELHTDNGGEFLNAVLYPYCQRERIQFTRGRPYKKNDQAYAEQKNWIAVRRVVGYDRYASRAAYEQLERLYDLLRRYGNFFQPLRKLVGKERVGAKVIKRYDTARTPYQRLLEAGVLKAAQRASLERLYRSLNPVRLRAEIDAALETLWKLAERRPRVGTGKEQECG